MVTVCLMSLKTDMVLDKNNPDDASQMAENGYTNIENYIFTLDERLDK